MVITSTGNNQVKDVMNLKKKASERRKRGLFILEGERIVAETPADRLEKLYVSESYLAVHGGSTLALAREHDGEAAWAECGIVSDRVFQTMADTQNPQGVLAVARMRECRAGELLDLDPQTAPVFVVLEHLQDPGNLGTILRTAEGAGVRAVLMSEDTVDIYNPKVIRATMGSLFRVPFAYVEDFGGLLIRMKEKGIRLCAAHLAGEHDYFEEDYTVPTAFLIGNEGNGLSDETAALADLKVKIPMEGRLESLNAAVSAALFMYEAKRQRRR